MFRRNVLIFHAGALGDFVLSWPLGLALGRLYPQSRILYVTQKQKGELAERVLRLEATDVELGWHHLFGDAEQLPEHCREKLRDAHNVFTYIAGPSDPWTSAVRSIAPQADVVPIDLRLHLAGSHASEVLLDALANRPTVQAAVRQVLSSISARGVGTLAFGNNRVLIHPGSGSRNKCWPLEAYLKLAEEIRAGGRPCRFLLGEVELDRWPADVIARIESTAPVARPATYIDLLGELCQAAAFVGNDSGPTHLAAIIGLPTVALFGPSDPSVWRPLGPRVTVLHRQPISDITVEEVHAATLPVAAVRI